MVEHREDVSELAIIIHVKDLNNHNHIRFKIKKDTPLERLMISYCETTGFNMGTLRFKFKGSSIRATDTARTIGILNNDSIYVSNVLY